MISVVGGVYRELCAKPAVDEIFGSAGRAAVAIALGGNEVELHSYCPDSLRETVLSSLEGSGARIVLRDSADQIAFRYLYPLARPTFSPVPNGQEAPIPVVADHVLRFGMMEGTAIVTAQKAVYDPQSSAELFSANGSRADELAVILNSAELTARHAEPSEEESVRALTATENAAIVIVKSGAIGAKVYRDGTPIGIVPPYKTERVYKIGSGDMFSAAFAHAWCTLALSEVEAADYASRSVARYCETRSPALVPPSALAEFEPVAFQANRQVYIAGPFFTVSDLWLVEEVWRALRAVGSRPFSPFHDIGLGRPEVIAPADLAAVDASGAVLALVSHCDPGTLVEVGYAIANKIPVVAVAENQRPSDMSMLVGTGCIVTDDLSTAIYRAAWESWR